jgi:uncharacterized protein (DUF58 family)
MPRPTRRGIGALAVLLALVGLTVGTGTAALLSLTVAVALPWAAAPFAAFFRARQARTRLAVETGVVPGLSVVGGEVEARIAVTNRTGRRAPVLWIAEPTARWRRRPAGTPTGDGHSRSPAAGRRPRLVPGGLVALPPATPHGRAVAESRVPSRRRGVFELALGHAWVLDPFGLFGAPGPVVPTATAVFYPHAAFDESWPVPRPAGAERDGAVPAPGPGRDGPGDLVGIRPYVPGDRLTLLHWPARARYGSWYVRQFAPERGAPARLVLDDRAGVHRQADFERMLACAHGWVEQCFDEGRTVELCTWSGRAATLAPAAAGLEEARVVLAGLLPVASGGGASGGGASGSGGGRGGTVLTTATGAARLGDEVERIVVR